MSTTEGAPELVSVVLIVDTAKAEGVDLLERLVSNCDACAHMAAFELEDDALRWLSTKGVAHVADALDAVTSYKAGE